MCGMGADRNSNPWASLTQRDSSVLGPLNLPQGEWASQSSLGLGRAGAPFSLDGLIPELSMKTNVRLGVETDQVTDV